MLEDGVQAAVDKAAEKLHDQLKPTHEDTEAFNETVTQAVQRAFESHLKDLTDKANQLKQSQGLTEMDPMGPGSFAKGKWLGPSPYWGDEPLCSPLNFKFPQTGPGPDLPFHRLLAAVGGRYPKLGQCGNTESGDPVGHKCHTGQVTGPVSYKVR